MIGKSIVDGGRISPLEREKLRVIQNILVLLLIA